MTCSSPSIFPALADVPRSFHQTIARQTKLLYSSEITTLRQDACRKNKGDEHQRLCFSRISQTLFRKNAVASPHKYGRTFISTFWDVYTSYASDMDLDYVMDSSDNEETNAIPASSQLTGSQWIARAHEAQLASDTASVQWQNSQTPIPALNALISQASKPVSRRPRKSLADHHDLPPVPLFSDTASTSRPASASTSRKASTSAVDSNAREKMRHKEKQGDKDQRKSRRSLDSASIRPRRHEVRADGRVSKARGMVKGTDFESQSRESKDRQVELMDQTNFELESHISRYQDMSGPSFDRSALSVATMSSGDASSMDVDSPNLPRIDTSGDWSISRAQPSAVSTSDGSLSASTSTTPTAASSRSQSAVTHGSSSSLVHSGRSSTLMRTTSAPQTRSTPSESSKPDQSASSAPSSQMSRTAPHLHPQISRISSQNSNLPPPPKRSVPRAPSPPAPASTPSPPSPVMPVQPIPLPLPRASQRPPPLGMRRVIGTTNSGFTPSQTLPTRQRPFKPPLARPRVNPAPASKGTDAAPPAKATPGRLPTPRSSPPAPAMSKQRRVPSPPPPAEADSSYGELSFDIDLLDAEMQKYD
ncbi:hypothetical protein EVG20_g3691 [Dentipellis fragilis]|uniref:Uncharacterized protein n=1 Tax=Dentipellis fragilis TaxID=205917 RepID=A0A4Y9Z0M7_9AGAM|nr:hypothetical protein EVG20_g3691 [Dentipellis fragilis]